MTIVKYIALLLFFILPCLIFGQSNRDASTFYYGWSVYLEGRPLYHAPKVNTSLPGQFSGDFSYALGLEGEWLFKPRWSIHLGVNYLYQRGDWEAKGLTTASDFVPLDVGPIVGSIDISFRRRWHQINIPLLLAYHKYFGQDKFSILTGFSTEWALAQKTEGFVTELGNTRPIASSNKSDMHAFSHALFAVSYQKKVAKNMWFGIRLSHW